MFTTARFEALLLHLQEHVLPNLLDLLSPRRCPGCGLIGNGRFCTDCGEPEPVPSDFRLEGVPVFVLGRYAGSLARAIRRLKYESKPELAAGLSELLALRLLREQWTDAAWVPVPLHFERLVERGYNQSALLARALAQRLGGTACPSVLRRARYTQQQARLDRAAREHNLADAFRVSRAPRSQVILVDDVLTTGSTVRAAIRALDDAGVSVRAVVALARAYTPR